ncbi:MAG: polysaccharide biosynthesis/export family protein [Flavobacteriales bacterium]
MLNRLLCVLAVGSLLISSCTINRDFMFRTDKEYVFDQPVLDSTSIEYRIAASDVMAFDLYTNDGALMLQFTTSDLETPKYGGSRDFTFTVDAEGYVEFPVIGRKYVVGYTVKELQDLLEELYAFQFRNPYAIVRVLNRRCIVFTGSGAKGEVVPLDNNNINIIEAIALAGGGQDMADVSQIKLIRKVATEQQVYLIDLSTIDGIKYANMSVQAGDIIYITPTPQIGRELLQDVQPFTSVISSLVITYGIVARLF